MPTMTLINEYECGVCNLMHNLSHTLSCFPVYRTVLGVYDLTTPNLTVSVACTSPCTTLSICAMILFTKCYKRWMKLLNSIQTLQPPTTFNVIRKLTWLKCLRFNLRRISGFNYREQHSTFCSFVRLLNLFFFGVLNLYSEVFSV